MTKAGPFCAVLLAASFGACRAETLFDPAYRTTVPADQARRFFQSQCAPLPEGIGKKITNVWTPGEKDVASADERLPSALRQAVDKTRWIGPISRSRLTDWEVVANHTRQYVGIMMSGRKLILVDAAPIYDVDFDGRHDHVQADDQEWRFKARGVCDGGPAEFSALYDPVTSKYEGFTFNGTIAGYSVP